MVVYASEEHVERAVAVRQGVGEGVLSPTLRLAMTSRDYHQALNTVASDHELVARVCSDGDPSAMLALCARYSPLIERVSRRCVQSGAFDREDAHQEAALVILEMALAGASDFHRRIERSVLYRVSDAAMRQSRTLTGFSRDQLRTARRALRETDENLAAARRMVTTNPDGNRRMRADTFDAICAILAPPVPIDETNDCPDSDGWPGDDSDIAAWLDGLLKQLDTKTRHVLIAAYGLYGFTERTDEALGDAIGCSRRQAARIRHDALAELRDAARQEHAGHPVSRSCV